MPQRKRRHTSDRMPSLKHRGRLDSAGAVEGDTGAATEQATTAALISPSSSSSSPLPSPSLWSLVAPFDSGDAQLPFCRRHLWPLLDDWAVVQSSIINRATLRYLSLIPIRSCTFWHTSAAQRQQSPLLWKSRPALPLTAVHSWPAVTRLTWEEPVEQLLPVLPRLPFLQHLKLLQVSTCIDGLLPPTLLSLQLWYNYAPLSASTFPAGLTELHLQTNAHPNNPHRGDPLLPGCLPPSLVSLYYDSAEDIPCGVLPSSLRLLHVTSHRLPGRVFRLLPGCLPDGLVELELAIGTYELGQTLLAALLPDSLRTLRLCYGHLHTPLGNVLTYTQLTTLYICILDYAQPFLSDTLPPTLTELDLTGATFWNHSLDGVLPPALRVLRLGERFHQPLTAATFASCPQLETLDLSRVHQMHTPFAVGALPPSLTDLRYPRRGGKRTALVGSLPASLKRLDRVMVVRTEPLTLLHALLPRGLEQLTLCSLTCPIGPGDLPPSLQELHLVSSVFVSLVGLFAADAPLRVLKLENPHWNETLTPHMLPVGLTELDVSETQFNCAIAARALPPALRKLCLSEHYAMPFTVHTFAECRQLVDLRVVSTAFTQSLTAELLPASLRELRLSRSYDVSDLRLPPTVRVGQYEGRGGAPPGQW